MKPPLAAGGWQYEGQECGRVGVVGAREFEGNWKALQEDVDVGGGAKGVGLI
jgi:hypothetical protein